MRNVRAGLALSLAVVAGFSTVTSAEETRQEVAGKVFDRGGRWRFWFGDGYRKAWTTPVELPVLDLQTEAGGLKPLREVGALETVGLALAGANGSSFTFRKLMKQPERTIPKDWLGSEVEVDRHDQTAAAHPAATAIVGSLARSVGIPFYASRVMVMPDDPLLGKFRETFANTVGTFDEYPMPGYQGLTEIISTDDLWKKWLEGGPENRVDSRAFVKARLFDTVVGNWDRHQGQWRWARFPGKPLWVPMPEDADQALTRYEGVVIDAGRTMIPRFMRYSGEYPGRLEGLTANNADVTRWFPAEVEWPVWEEVARELTAQMTDAAIDEAMHQMPAEVVRDRRRADDERPEAAARRAPGVREEVLSPPRGPRGGKGHRPGRLRDGPALRRRLPRRHACSPERRRVGGHYVLPPALLAEGNEGGPRLSLRRQRSPGDERAQEGRHHAASARREGQRRSRRLQERRGRHPGLRGKEQLRARTGHERGREHVEEPRARRPTGPGSSRGRTATGRCR